MLVLFIEKSHILGHNQLLEKGQCELYACMKNVCHPDLHVGINKTCGNVLGYMSYCVASKALKVGYFFLCCSLKGFHVNRTISFLFNHKLAFLSCSVWVSTVATVALLLQETVEWINKCLFLTFPYSLNATSVTEWIRESRTVACLGHIYSSHTLSHQLNSLDILVETFWSQNSIPVAEVSFNNNNNNNGKSMTHINCTSKKNWEIKILTDDPSWVF